ncbi:MAG: protein kinase [Candidatus Eisenbacteria sp.]|nr:protein kinase [Candidatus Eisenbacteria bacterium]
MIGKVISHYRILEKLGEGGMGVVYKAQDTKLKRTVALKFLTPQAVGTDDDKTRFIHEAQAAAALNHPNICTVHEIDEAEGRIFIAIEYIEGQSLKEKIEAGPLKINEAADIGMQIAQGLQEAHEKGIVHRDIKPANIMITPRGQAKIMDFGLAKSRGQTALTKADTTLGTYAYMAPEQARGEDVDARTDIWSLGAVLYEMMTGQRPFKGDYEQAVIYSILNEEPEPATGIRTGIPMEMERIITKCLRKDPGQRYQGAADLVTDLRQVRSDFTTTRTTVSAAAQPERGGGLMRWSWVAIVALLIALAAVILPRCLPSPEKLPSDERKMLVVLPFENLGSADDEYFAAGMTEEITSRLAVVGGLGIISRTSAVRYDRTGKTLREIGADLGVDYVLEGTVRWNKNAAGGSRVRVTPQLIRVSDDTHLWAEAYDRVLEDIFAVQSDIAERIINQLGITMLERERSAVEAKPTENLLAYEAYLRGLVHVSQAGSLEDRWRKAETLLQQAVDLDPSFALAFARLAEVHSEFYFWGFDKTEERQEKARRAAERSLELQPDLPQGHLALGGYYYTCFFDYDRALKELAIAAEGLPNHPRLLETIAYIWRRQGLWQEAIGNLEKAAKLDPANFWYPLQLGVTYSLTRQYPEAERYLDRSLSLDPEQVASYFIKSRNTLMWNGDLWKTRAILESAPTQTSPVIPVLMFFQYMYEREYQKGLDVLSRLPEEVTGWATEVTPRSLLEGYAYQRMGETGRAHDSYDTTVLVMTEFLQEHPEDGSAHGVLGMAYAGLGRKEDAIREAKRGLELSSNDAIRSAEREWDLAVVYIMLGEHDAALGHIEHLLSVPSWVSVPHLKITPTVDPLRDHPRFQRLMEEYAMDGAT